MFNLAVLLFIYVILRLQGHLPLNPAHVPDMSPTVAFNTAVSFATNTNWQVYVPESQVSLLSQMLALARENFVSAAVGIAVAVAFIRGLTRHSGRELGNFWVDMTRSFLYVLLPISIIGTLVLVSQGVVQNLNGPTHAVTVEGVTQTIAQGPFASQEIIKELGTNGGGSYNANSAHPYENPTPLTNFIEMLAILAIPVSLTYTFGRFAGNQRQGWALFAAAMAILLMSVAVMYASEQRGNPILTKLGANQTLDRHPGGRQHGGQGGALRDRRLDPLGSTVHDRHVVRAPSTTATTASRRLPAAWRCSTSPSARWCSAASASASWGCSSTPSWRCSSPASWSAEHRSTSARRSRAAR